MRVIFSLLVLVAFVAVVSAQQQQGKSIRYAQPIVTYAQPIVQQMDTTPPKVEKQHLTAQAIIQPTFQTAPVQNVQPIMATAPTIQKGYGSSLGLGQWSQFNQPQQQQPKLNLARLNLNLQNQNQNQPLNWADPSMQAFTQDDADDQQ